MSLDSLVRLCPPVPREEVGELMRSDFRSSTGRQRPALPNSRKGLRVSRSRTSYFGYQQNERARQRICYVADRDVS